MRQFVLPDYFTGQDSLILEEEDFHYLCHVLRQEKGASFPGIDKHGCNYSIIIEDIGKKSCSLAVKRITQGDMDEEAPRITLYQCLPKGKKIDQIIRQATECGVHEIVPVLSEFTVPQIKDPKDKKKKQQRWEKIAVEAVQQSGAKICPVIKEPIYFKEIPNRTKNMEINLFFHEKPLENSSLHGYLSIIPKSLSIIIGPEGGLSPKEVALLIEHDFLPVYLGDTILRAETAAIYALGAVKVILLEKNTWKKVQ